MNLDQIRLVYLKEMKDVIRDKRTIRLMILVPVVFYPLMSFGVSGLAINMAKKAEQRAAPVYVVGEMPEVQKALLATDGKMDLLSQQRFDSALSALDPVEYKAVASKLDAWRANPYTGLSDSDRTAFYYASIKGKAADCIVEVPDHYQPTGPGDSVNFKIYFDEQEFRSDAAHSKVEKALRSYRDSLSIALLTSAGLTEAGAKRAIKPFWLESTNVAPAEKQSGFFLALMLPYMIVLMVMLGAMYPAIDLTAGEKERGTLETILASAAGRTEVTAGKFLCVFTAAMVTVILGAASMTITSGLGLMKMGNEAGAAASSGFQFSINPVALFVVVLMMIPAAVLVSAGLLAIAIMARSYKEAQSYVSPLMFVVIIPSLVSFMPGIELNAALAWVPITNIALAVRTALLTAKGEVFPWGLLALVFAVTALYALFALFLVRQMFNKESVLFRT